MAEGKNTVNVDRAEYDAMRDRIAELESDAPAPADADGWWKTKPVSKDGWLWIAPEYFSRWRIFPRVSMTECATNLSSVRNPARCTSPSIEVFVPSTPTATACPTQ